MQLESPMNGKVSRRVLAGLLLGWLAAAPVVRANPFRVTAERTVHARSDAVLVRFTIPEKHVLYPDSIRVTSAAGLSLESLLVPPAVRHTDPITSETKLLFTESFDAVYALPDGLDSVRVEYQGCNDEVCFMPQTVDLSLDGAIAPASVAEPLPSGFALPGDFKVRATGIGYKREGEFLEFLAEADASVKAARASPRGFWATLVLILFGGIALNFTPCVLPMIPINLAIIGAGSRASSKGRGFFLGSVYGLGMAVAYGALGAGVVLTGARFGQINASPGFNAAIALLFLVMALAMFDVIRIDLSRFQGGSGTPSRTGAWAVFGMGGIAALLAGACVAPVVISVLLLAGTQVAAGNWAGLLWPFLLGVGMALPWPFAGAGLARLPKPGAWMNRVKYGFGLFILLMALYYGNLARQTWVARGPAGPASGAGTDGPSPDWDQVWAQAREQNKPVFIDFWASWCKNCEAMEKTTFARPAVRARLSEFVVVKYRAEQMAAEPARSVLNAFGVRGLPTYVILVPG
jgi:thiol:disulfide interchange protein